MRTKKTLAQILELEQAVYVNGRGGWPVTKRKG